LLLSLAAGLLRERVAAPPLLPEPDDPDDPDDAVPRGTARSPPPLPLLLPLDPDAVRGVAFWSPLSALTLFAAE